VMVDERTQELSMKNDQLSEYAFINAHKLRAPLARIMGLLQIYRMKDSELSTGSLMDMLTQEAHGLDVIVRSITEAIEDKRIFNRHDL
jgi:light-regulated signal transduction histidine kinase (bacteriophytochrome)